MDSIELQLGFACNRHRKENRYIKHNIARRKLRRDGKKFNCYDLSTTAPRAPSIVDLNDWFILEDYEVLGENLQLGEKTENDPNEHVSSLVYEENDPSERASLLVYEENDCRISIISSDACDEPERTLSDDEIRVSPKVPLHDYTTNSTCDYCEAFTIAARRANLSRSSTNEFLSLIKAGLPTPNHLPSTEEALLLLLGVEDLFTKRSICLLCFRELDVKEQICSRCQSTNQNSIAYV